MSSDDNTNLARCSANEAEDFLTDFLFTAAPRQNRTVTYNLTGTAWPEPDFADTYDSTFHGHWEHNENPYLEGDDGGGTVEFCLNFVND